LLGSIDFQENPETHEREALGLERSAR
jgi:hypothetical protein